MNHKYLLNEIKSEINKSFENLIEKVILFGSRADNTARKNSDYDVLLLVNYRINWQDKDRVLDIISELNIKYDIIIDSHLLPVQDLGSLKGKQPYIQKALETGIAV